MKRLDYHKHLVNMLGCISDTENPVIVLEFCEHGDLLRFLRQRREILIKVRQG
jgi:receptor protein-tyrosine kinase